MSGGERACPPCCRPDWQSGQPQRPDANPAYNRKSRPLCFPLTATGPICAQQTPPLFTDILVIGLDSRLARALEIPKQLHVLVVTKDAVSAEQQHLCAGRDPGVLSPEDRFENPYRRYSDAGRRHV